jgi:hypothetical protein
VITRRTLEGSTLSFSKTQARKCSKLRPRARSQVCAITRAPRSVLQIRAAGEPRSPPSRAAICTGIGVLTRSAERAKAAGAMLSRWPRYRRAPVPAALAQRQTPGRASAHDPDAIDRVVRKYAELGLDRGYSGTRHRRGAGFTLSGHTTNIMRHEP